MNAFERHDRFDLSLNLSTSFGYYAEDDDNRRVLANVRSSLRDGGVFVIETVGKETLARIFTPSSVDSHEDGTLIAQTRRVVDDWSRIESDWTIIRDGAARTYRVEHWRYSATEIKAMCRDAGFDRVEVYGSLGGTSYDHNSRRLVVVAN